MNSTNKEAMRPWRLFLVEDNPADVVILREALAEAGLTVDTEVAGSGSEALARLHACEDDPARGAPDLILLDLNLPHMGGLELLALLKNDRILKSIPVLVLSTSRNERDVSESYRLHANGYLQKPLEFASFVRMLRSVHEFWACAAVPPSAVQQPCARAA